MGMMLWDEVAMSLIRFEHGRVLRGWWVGVFCSLGHMISIASEKSIYVIMQEGW